MPLPLEGTRIVAVEQFGAGPFGSMVLADLGAEVVKIEDPTTGGEVGRTVPPYLLPGNDSLYFQSFNRNKRSLALDMRSREGRAIFEALVKVSGAVYNNLRGDLPRKLGLDYDSLKHLNPRIVCCSLTGFGTSGPRAAEPGYDYLMQGYSGIMSITGEPDSAPVKCGISMIDFAGGYVSMIGLVAGLVQSLKVGRGCNVEVSLVDTAVAMLSYLAVWHLNRGYQPEKIADSAHPALVPSQLFPTRDGYVIVMCFKEKFWGKLCELLGCQDLAEDARFKTFSDRLQHKEVLIPILKGRFREGTTTEWLERLRGHVPCGPVNDVAQALRDPQILHNEMVVEVPHSSEGKIKEIACPIKVNGERHPLNRAPGFGEHTEEMLRDVLGLSAEEIAGLKSRGVIGGS